MTDNIKLVDLRFQELILPKDRIVFRVASNSEHTYQNPIPEEGRFNQKGMPIFYCGSNNNACAFEILSHRPSVENLYVFQYKLNKPLKLVDMSRWQFQLPENGAAYPPEWIVINQYITCPKREWSQWLYGGTNVIAKWAMKTGYDGILYQSAVAHQLDIENPSVQRCYNSPEALFNYAVFQTPDESKKCFQMTQKPQKLLHIDNLKEIALNKINDAQIESLIKCKNAWESVAGVLNSNPKYKPSLNIIELEP